MAWPVMLERAKFYNESKGVMRFKLSRGANESLKHLLKFKLVRPKDESRMSAEQ